MTFYFACCGVFGSEPEVIDGDDEKSPELPQPEKENNVPDQPPLKVEETEDAQPQVLQPENGDFDVDAFLTKLKGGIRMKKFGRHGRGEDKTIYTPDGENIGWKETKAKDASNKLFRIKEIKAIRTSETQRPQVLSSVSKRGANEATALQIALPGRDIDLEAASVFERDEFIQGLNALKGR